MTEYNGDSPEGTVPPTGPATGKTGNSVKLLLVAVAVIAGLAILYGMNAGGGKDGADKLASVCQASKVVSAKIAPLAVDKLAALAVPRQPKPAVNIGFDGPDSMRLTLDNFKGKTILLNLWATWCVPCRAEMPELDQLQKSLGGPDFEVVAVNIDTARLDRRKIFLDSIGIKHLAFYADSQAESFQTLKQAGKVLGLPATFLIDARGCEIGRMAGPAAWASDQAIKLIRTAISK
jgi:thiol-disulfide isomerase/thioredoxin